MYLVFPGIMILITLLSPESPRWLLINGKAEKARNIVFKMHTVNGNDEFAQAEFTEMEKQIAIDRTLETSWVCEEWLRAMSCSCPRANADNAPSSPCSPSLRIVNAP